MDKILCEINDSIAALLTCGVVARLLKGLLSMGIVSVPGLTILLILAIGGSAAYLYPRWNDRMLVWAIAALFGLGLGVWL